MKILKFFIFFVLFFAVISIVMIQNGETRYFTDLKDAYKVILEEWDFDFEHMHDSLDDIQEAWNNLERRYDDLGLTVGGGDFGPSLDAQDPFSKMLAPASIGEFFEGIGLFFSRLWGALMSFFTLIPEYLSVFGSVVGLLIAFLVDGISFLVSCISLVWALFVPAELR